MQLGIVSKLVGLLALHTAEAAFQIVPGATWTAVGCVSHQFYCYSAVIM